MPESRNPVGRRNQPRMQCCACTLSAADENEADAQEAADAAKSEDAGGPGVLTPVGQDTLGSNHSHPMRGGTCASRPSLRCNSDVDCVDDTRGVRRQVGPCVGMGVCSDTLHSRTTPRTCIRDVPDCLLPSGESNFRGSSGSSGNGHQACLFWPPALDGICENDVTKLCRLDVQCGLATSNTYFKCMRNHSIDSRGFVGYCLDDATQRCAVDAHCVKKVEGSGLPTTTTDWGDHIDGMAAKSAHDNNTAKCIMPGHCARLAERACVISSQCVEGTTDVGPCVGSGGLGYSPALAAAIATREAQMKMNGKQLGADEAGTGTTTSLAYIAASAHADNAFGLALEERMKLQAAINNVAHRGTESENDGRSIASPLLSAAQQACLLLGPAKCNRDIQTSLSNQDIDVMTSYKNLRAGLATLACVQLGARRCHMPYSQAVKTSTSQENNYFEGDSLVAHIIIDLQAQAKALWQRIVNADTKALDFHLKQVQNLEMQARSEIGAASLSTARVEGSNNTANNSERFLQVAGVAASRNALTGFTDARTIGRDGSPIQRNGSFFEPLLEKEKRKMASLRRHLQVSKSVLHLVDESQAAVPSAAASMSANARHARHFAVSSTIHIPQDDHLAECNSFDSNQTAHCYCKVLGQQRCANSLFASYLHHDVAAIAAIRALLVGNATSPAVTVCRVLGPEKCRESISYALQHGHIDVVQAWKFLVNGTLPLYTLTNLLPAGRAEVRCSSDNDCSFVKLPQTNVGTAQHVHKLACYEGWCVPLLSYSCQTSADCAQGMFCAHIAAAGQRRQHDRSRKTHRMAISDSEAIDSSVRVRLEDGHWLHNDSARELEWHRQSVENATRRLLDSNPHQVKQTVNASRHCWVRPSCRLRSVQELQSSWKLSFRTQLLLESARQETVACPAKSFLRCEPKHLHLSQLRGMTFLDDAESSTLIGTNKGGAEKQQDEFWCAPVNQGALCCVNSDCAIGQRCALQPSDLQQVFDNLGRSSYPPAAVLQPNSLSRTCPGVSDGSGFGTCAAVEPGISCNDAVECGNGATCRKIPSRTRGECFFGQYNYSFGSWGLSSLWGSPCSGTHQCAVGARCTSQGWCALSPQGSACNTTWDCGRGYRCVSKHCLLFEGSPKQPCRFDWECGAAQVCRLPNFTCELLPSRIPCPCPAAQVFASETGEGAPRVVDFVCREGVCVSVGIGSPCHPSTAQFDCGNVLTCAAVTSNRLETLSAADELIELESHEDPGVGSTTSPVRLAQHHCVLQSCRHASDCRMQQICQRTGRGRTGICVLVADGTPCSASSSSCGNGQICLRGQCLRSEFACPKVHVPSGGFVLNPGKPRVNGISNTTGTTAAPQLIDCDVNSCIVGCYGGEVLSVTSTQNVSLFCAISSPAATHDRKAITGHATWQTRSPGGIDPSTVEMLTTDSHEPVTCDKPGICLPLSRTDAAKGPPSKMQCIGYGTCVCKIPMDPTANEVVNVSVAQTKQRCESLVEQSTAKPCKWKRSHLWAHGTSSNRIFLAVDSGTPQTVEFILASFPNDVNLRQGLNVCNLGAQTSMPVSWSAEDRLWCSTEANLRPLDLAKRRISRAAEEGPSSLTAAYRIFKTLLFYGGTSGATDPNIFPWTWAKVAQADNLTVNDDTNQGIHGYLQFFPTWLCQDIRSAEGLTGCYRRAVSEFDGDCDADTSVGCECDPSSFESSPALACMDAPGSSGMMRKSIHRQGGGGDTTITQGVVSKPEDCDWNPFTNLLYFLFCIILKILKPIITAVFVEVPDIADVKPLAPLLSEHGSFRILENSFLDTQAGEFRKPVSSISSYDFQLSNAQTSAANTMIRSFRDMVKTKAPDWYDDLSGSLYVGKQNSPVRQAHSGGDGPAFFDSPRAMHGHAAVSVDWGRGVLVFGGCANPDNSTNAGVGLEYFNDIWWYRLGFDQSQRKIRWFGHMWLPARIAGVYPSPRAFHSMVSVGAFESSLIPARARKERTVLVFGGFDGKQYFDDLFAVVYTEQALGEISALRNATSKISTDELAVRRAQTFLFKQAEQKCRNSQMTRATVNTSDERLGFRFCMAQHALPWHGEPFYRTSGTKDEGGAPWLRSPKWVGPLDTKRKCSARSRHGAVVVGSSAAMIVYGGEGPHGLLDDVCIMPLAGSDAGLWSVGWPGSHGRSQPVPRAGHTMVAIGTRVYVYGGYSLNAGLLDELLILDVVGCQQYFSTMPGPDPVRCATFVRPAASNLSEVLRWKHAKSIGVRPPVGRFGHQMALALGGLHLLIVGGFGGSGTQSNWRERKREIGKRNDIWTLDLHVPNVTKVWPTTASPTGVALPDLEPPDVILQDIGDKAISRKRYLVRDGDVRQLNGSGLRPARIFIEGVNFGEPCKSFSSHGSHHIPRCNATCTSDTCSNSHWHDNNEKSGVRVLIGENECSHISWISPNLLSCEVPAGVGHNLDVRVLANGQATPKGNRLFSYSKPVVRKVVPSFLLDYPGVARGPFQIWGNNFGFHGSMQSTNIPVARSSASNTTIWIGNQRCLATRHVSDQLLICLCVARDGGREGMKSGLASVVVNVGGQWAELPKAVEVLVSPTSLEQYFQSPEKMSADIRSAKARQNATTFAPSPAAGYIMRYPEGVACPDPDDDALVDLFSGINLTMRRSLPTSTKFPDDKLHEFESTNASARIVKALDNSSAVTELQSVEADKRSRFVARGNDANALLTYRPAIFLERSARAVASSKVAASLPAAREWLVAEAKETNTSIGNGTIFSRTRNGSGAAHCNLVPIVVPNATNVLDVARFGWSCNAACASLFVAASRGAIRLADIAPQCQAFLQVLAWEVACDRHKEAIRRDCAPGLPGCGALKFIVDMKCSSPSTESVETGFLRFALNRGRILPVSDFFKKLSSRDHVLFSAKTHTPETAFRFQEQPFSIHVDRSDSAGAASRNQNGTEDLDLRTDQPILVEWLPFDTTCKIGRPALPRRDFTLTPVAGNGFMIGSNATPPALELGAAPTNEHWFRALELGSSSFVVFGGRGLNAGIRASDYLNQTENDIARPSEQDINYWASSKPLPAVDFNDTFLLLDVFAAPSEEKRLLGIESGSCPGTGTVRGSALIPPTIVGAETVHSRRKASDLMREPEGYPKE
eukprot:INCI17604.1.p1 GENE.INCI17604.1~~INCI17604.1.p1  ORF type:complete len:3612 (-),score=407.72 INCI17604.1:16-9351(-)